ncbi:serine/threonine-protein phosphatase, partial [Streptomyces flaveolus]
TGWTDSDPDTFLDHLRNDLLHHARGHLDDDAAMIAIERPAR